MKHETFSRINFLCIIAVSVSCTYAAIHQFDAEDVDFILSGVNEIRGVSSPGVLSVYGENAFPLVAGETDRIVKPFVGGGRYGDGRIVCFSHTSFMIVTEEDISGFDNAQLFLNAVNWAGASSARKRFGVTAWSSNEEDILDFLTPNGYTGEILIQSQMTNLTYLRQFDMLIVSTGEHFNNNEQAYEVVKDYVRTGGGLVLGSTPWSYYPPPGESYFYGFWANNFLRDSGILFVEGGTYRTTANGFNASQDFIRDTHAGPAWENIKRILHGEEETINGTHFRQVLGIMRDRVLFGPENATLISEMEAELSSIPHFSPTKEEPLTSDLEKSFLLAHRYMSDILVRNNMFNTITEHAAAKDFPGSAASEIMATTPSTTTVVEINGVPPDWVKKMPRSKLSNFLTNSNNLCTLYDDNKSGIQDVVEINTNYTSWHSTGLYAPAGTLILVNILDSVDINNYAVQIGAHTDNIERLTDWWRCPQIVYSQGIIRNTARLVSPFGGMIYIIVPEDATGVVRVSINGIIIKAPTYFRGQTQMQKWRQEIRYNPAPWGELVGNSIVLSVRKQHLVIMDNPEELIELWDRVLDAIADLAVIPRVRVKPERIVADVQISAGWMHSGYPIMTFLDVETDTARYEVMREQSHRLWGHFHELGHNHQRSDWGFEGTGEVTCNVFALYVMHSVLGVPTNLTHPALNSTEVRIRLQTYIDNGKPFSEWRSNPWLALHIYIQLQEAFGWDSYKTVFGKYHSLPGNERPGTDQQKIDLWMVTFSNAVEENLTPFFRSWGFTITSEAEAKVSHLPETVFRIPTP